MLERTCPVKYGFLQHASLLASLPVGLSSVRAPDCASIRLTETHHACLKLKSSSCCVLIHNMGFPELLSWPRHVWFHGLCLDPILL